MKAPLWRGWLVLSSVILVLFDAPARAQVGGPGSALNFDGTNSYVQAPSSVWFNGNFTIEGWVYARSYNSGSRLIDFGTGSTSPNSVYLALSSGGTGQPVLGVYINGGETTVQATNSLPLNQWVHLACTLSNNTGTIYINGVNVGSGFLNQPANLTRSLNYIGRSNFPGDGYANAIFDEIRIWGIARSQAQVQAWMHRSLVGNEAGLRGYWRFDEGSGATTADNSGHAETGTLFGATSWTNSTAPIISGAGGSISLNGSQFGTVPHQAALNAYPLTAMAWFKTTNGGGALVNKYVSSSFNGFNLFIPGGGNLLGWYMHDAANNVFNGGPMDAGFVADGIWHHAAMVIDASGGKLYLDGVQKSSLPWSGTPGAPTTTQALNFGLYPGDSLSFGQIDEVSLWNTALSGAQIQSCMNHPLVGNESGLLGYWRMDEGVGTNVVDSTGHGYNATLPGSPAWVASAAPIVVPDSSYGLNLTGTKSEYVQVPNGVWFNGDFTFEGWVYLRSYNNWSRFFDFSDGPYTNNVYLALSQGTSGLPVMGVFTNNDTTAPILIGSTPVPTNQWAHIAATLSGTTGTIYINGNPVGSATLRLPPNILRTNNYLGHDLYGDIYANAVFDEIRIWNVARSQAQIQSTMNKTLLGSESGLIGYWRFDEGTGVNTVDGTGLGNTATLINGPTWLLVNPPLSVPLLTTLPATAVAGGSTTLNGSVVPNGQATADWFQWGTTTSYGNTTPVVAAGSGLAGVAASAVLTNLLANTTYHFRLTATNNTGAGFGSDLSFTTGSFAPTIMNAAATNDVLGGTTLKASVAPNGATTAVWFAYGTDTTYGTTNFLGQIGSGVNPVPVSITASNLAAATVYHFQVSASNALGAVSSPDVSFTIATIPVITGQSATNITRTSATLNASVAPNGATTSVRFQYGLTTNYGSTAGPFTVGTNSAPVPLNSTLNNLSAGTLYHFQVVATNVAGASVTGDAAFITLPPGAPTITVPVASGISVNGFTLSSQVNPQNAATAVWFEWGTNTAYGNATPVANIGAGGAAVPVNISVVTNVMANLTNYFRVVASNSVGVTNLAGSFIFSSGPLVTLSAPTTTSNTLTLIGTINPEGLPTAAYFHSDLFGDLSALSGVPLNGYNPITVTQFLASASYPWPALRFSYSLHAFDPLGRTVSQGRYFAPPLLTPNGTFLSAECPFTVSDPGVNVQDATILAIAAGLENSMALKEDGTVLIWGANNANQLTLPFNLNKVKGIAVGADFAMALTNGTVVAWGNNANGQLNVPAGLTNAVAIAARTGSALALRSDGTLVGWGATPAVPAGTYEAIAVGISHCVALSTSGTVIAWGDNSVGQLNVPSSTGIKAITSGANHSMALRSDGFVFLWGDNSSGQLNIPGIQGNVMAIAAGTTHSLALLRNGAVVAWGGNASGQATVPPAATANVVAIAAGTSHSLALKSDGTIVAWGDNTAGQTNVPSYTRTFTGTVRTNGLDTSSPGFKTVTYTATSLLGDSALTTKTLQVGDHYPPQLTLLGSIPMITPVNTPYVDPGLIATDNCAGLNLILQTNSTVNTGVIGTYSITYTARDPSGNSSSIQRLVQVADVPSASSVAATNITVTGATLQAVVDANNAPTVVSFLWGTDLSYGQTNLALGNLFGINQVPLGQNITGLQPGVTYHFNVMAVNAIGLAQGNDLSFTTLARPSITAITPLGGNVYQIALTGTPGASYTLQTSTNLSDWLVLTNLTVDVSGNLQFTTDNNSNYPALFFRLSYP